MAECIFNGFGNVSGTLSKRTFLEDGRKVTTRVVAQVRGGKQRIYIRRDAQRSTPITEGEIRARTIFTITSARVKELSPEQLKEYAKEAHNNCVKGKGFKYKDKIYRTLNGFIRAHVYELVAKEFTKG